MKSKRTVTGVVVVGLLLVALSGWLFSARAVIFINSVVSGGSSYVMQETFEGSTLCFTGGTSNCDLTWEYNASPEADYAGTNAPLEGSYSLMFNSASDVLARDFDNSATEVYASVMVNTADVINDGQIVAILGSGESACKAGWYGAGYICFYNEGGSTDCTAGTLSSNTTYYVKVRAKVGIGSDAECQGYTSTDGTSWTAETATTDGTWTTNPKRIDLRGVTTALKVLDDVRVSTSDINY